MKLSTTIEFDHVDDDFVSDDKDQTAATVLSVFDVRFSHRRVSAFEIEIEDLQITHKGSIDEDTGEAVEVSSEYINGLIDFISNSDELSDNCYATACDRRDPACLAH